MKPPDSDKDGLSAIKNGDVHFIQRLLAKDKTAALSFHCQSADLLVHAIREQQLLIIKLLVEAGADLHSTRPYKRHSPLSACLRHPEPAIFSYLLSQGLLVDGELPDYNPRQLGDPDMDHRPAAPYIVRELIQMRDVTSLKVLFDHGVDIFDSTGLHLAPFDVACRWSAECLSFMMNQLPSDMLRQKINTPITLADPHSHTASALLLPLRSAASRGNLACVRLLIAAGADPLATDALGHTALNSALKAQGGSRNPELISFLSSAMESAELSQATPSNDSLHTRSKSRGL